MLDSLNTKTYPGIDSLKWVDAKTVAQLMRAEHPQTIAVCLAQMEAEQAGQSWVAAGSAAERRGNPDWRRCRKYSRKS
ncbi:MAG: hypothetical protein U0361_03580 [Nitrospiraceae bacterium]